MQQPPMADGSYKAPGKMFVLRRAMPGDLAANAQWDGWRDFWLQNWGWNKVLAEPSMFWTTTKNGVARMEVDNNDFLVIAPTQADLDVLSVSLQAWKIKIQKLTYADSVSTTISRTEVMQSGPEDNVSSEKNIKFSARRAKNLKVALRGDPNQQPKFNSKFTTGEQYDGMQQEIYALCGKRGPVCKISKRGEGRTQILSKISEYTAFHS